MIRYEQGNLFETPDQYIAHGCNACGVMGSGVALQIKERYPEAFEAYKKTWVDIAEVRKDLGLDSPLLGFTPLLPLGTNIIVHTKNKTIINMITQEYYGNDQRHVNYEAVQSCFESLARIENISSLSIPKIGAGLGGGDWEIIAKIIEKAVRPDQIVTVWELK